MYIYTVKLYVNVSGENWYTTNLSLSIFQKGKLVISTDVVAIVDDAIHIFCSLRLLFLCPFSASFSVGWMLHLTPEAREHIMASRTFT